MTRIGKGKVMQDTIGRDVSKATLDAYWLSGKQHLVFSNDLAGLKRLVRWICKAKASGADLSNPDFGVFGPIP
jgi:hypothetical protein